MSLLGGTDGSGKAKNQVRRKCCPYFYYHSVQQMMFTGDNFKRCFLKDRQRPLP